MKAEEQQAQADCCPPHAEHGCGPPSIHCCWPHLTTPPHRSSAPCHTHKLENTTGRPLSLLQCIINCCNTSDVTVTLCRERSHYFNTDSFTEFRPLCLLITNWKPWPPPSPLPRRPEQANSTGPLPPLPSPPPSLSYCPEMGKRTLAAQIGWQTKATFRQKRRLWNAYAFYTYIATCNLWTGTPQKFCGFATAEWGPGICGFAICGTLNRFSETFHN